MGTPGDRPPGSPRQPEGGQQQGRKNRTQAPDGRQVEQESLCRRGRVHPGHWPQEDEDVHGEQQADDRPCQEDRQELESLRALRGPDGRPQTEEQVNLGEDRETDDDEPEGAEGDCRYHKPLIQSATESARPQAARWRANPPVFAPVRGRKPTRPA